MNKVLDFRHETPPLPSVPFSHHLQLAMSDHTQAAKSSATKGVAAVLSGSVTHRTAFNLFCIPGRVAVVTGGHRGIGLEIALALAEAGALVYCLDLPASPDANWKKVERFVTVGRLASWPEFKTGIHSYVYLGFVANQRRR